MEERGALLHHHHHHHHHRRAGPTTVEVQRIGVGWCPLHAVISTTATVPPEAHLDGVQGRRLPHTCHGLRELHAHEHDLWVAGGQRGSGDTAQQALLLEAVSLCEGVVVGVDGIHLVVVRAWTSDRSVVCAIQQGLLLCFCLRLQGAHMYGGTLASPQPRAILLAEHMPGWFVCHACVSGEGAPSLLEHRSLFMRVASDERAGRCPTSDISCAHWQKTGTQVLNQQHEVDAIGMEASMEAAGDGG
eukprot:1139417-Pelagomonas_calceolata.AAC.3